MLYGVGAALLRRFGGFEIGAPLNAYTLLLAPIVDGEHFAWNLGSWFIFPLYLEGFQDVLHYLPSRELRAGLPGLAEMCAGVAWLETFTSDDTFEGDQDGFQPRDGNWYRRNFRQAGFQPLGSHLWLGPQWAGQTAALESAIR